MSVVMICSSRFRLSLFLIQLWIGLISCAMYHIVPSPDHHCPVESCLALSSFAANVSLYLDRNTSLIFQPGNHTVHSELNVTNVTEFSMTSYSAKQSSVGITCDKLLSLLFFFEAVDYVHLSNLKFFGCESTLSEIGPTEHTLIKAILSNLILLEYTFESNKGRIVIISAEYSNITIE